METVFLFKSFYLQFCFQGLPSEVLDSMDIENINAAVTTETKTSSPDPDQPLRSESGCLVEEEERETGVVKLDVYKVYWKAVGVCLAPSVLMALFLMQGLSLRLLL